MLIGSRSGFAVKPKQKWQNPYITDGLVAMWDGQWNAGPGRHDGNSTKWINLVTNEATAITGVSFQDMYLDIPRYASVILSNDILLQSNATIEILTKCYNVSRIVNILNTSSSVRHLRTRESSGTTNSRLIINMPFTASGKNSYYFGEPTYRNWTIGPYSFSLCGEYHNSGSDRGFYLNGTIPSFSNYASNSYSNDGTATLNGEQYVYCVRIYSRTLSQIEVSTNYAVDKARFNL